MADTKITSLLTPQVTTNPATDVLPIVNIADTSMASSGSTRKITVNTLLGSGGTATLASATITGDLTVDTSTLYVSSSTDKVGIGTTSLSGEKLTVAGNISANAWLGRGNIAAPSGDCSIFRSADNTLGFGIASTTAMTLNSTGLGVGVVPSAGAKLSVLGSTTVNTTNYIGASTWAAQFVGSSNGASSGLSLLSYSASGLPAPVSIHAVPISDYRSALVATYSADASGSGYFAVNQFNPAGSSTVERFRIDRDGNVGIGVTPSAGKGCLQLSSGINFPATQVASSDANTLDDYEEGTFTPAVTGSTTAGTATYVGRSGKYTKIGNLVQVQIFIDYNSHTGTGDTRITGLPFTNGANFSAASVGYANGLTLTAGNYVQAYVDASQSFILLNQAPTGGGSNTTVPIDPAATLVITATYTI